MTAGIVLAVLTGWLFPVAGGDFLRGPSAIGFGVWLIFFIQGMALPTAELLRGYRPLRLPAFVLGWNFLFYPLWTALLVVSIGRGLPAEIKAGFFLLSVLPTTIASAVSFTALAHGRTAAAVVCTVASNLLAVLVVPLAAFFYGISGEMEFRGLGKVWWEVARLVVIPLLLGQALRWAWAGLVVRLGPSGRWATSLIICFIVHLAFARRDSGAGWEELSGLTMVWVFVLTVAMLVSGHWIVWRSSGWCGFSAADRLAAFFCASQKALASGLPMILSILAVSAQPAQAALVILPLLIFHPLQLLLAALWSARA